MGTYDLFRKIAKSDITEKDRTIDQIQYDISSDFEDSPSYELVTVSGVSKNVQIISDKNGIKTILSKPNESLSAGDVVELADDTKYLIQYIDADDKIQSRGTILECNNSLVFYKSQIYAQIPCVIESSVQLYRMGYDENKTIAEPSTIIVVRIPNTPTTQLIRRDDIFRLGSQNYRVVDVSDVIEKGLIIFKMEYSQEEQILPTFSVSILNGDDITIGLEQPLQLNVSVYDGISDTPLSPTPLITYTSSDEEICTVDDDGLVNPVAEGTCNITATLTDILPIGQSCLFNSNVTIDDDGNVVITEVDSGNAVFMYDDDEGIIVAQGDLDIDEVISSSIEVTVGEVEDNYTYEISGDAEVILNNTNTYTAKKYNNGILVTDSEFTFEIVSGSTPLSAYTLTTLDDTQCTITANSKPYTITLKAIDVDSGTEVTKSIKLISLF